MTKLATSSKKFKNSEYTHTFCAISLGTSFVCMTHAIAVNINKYKLYINLQEIKTNQNNISLTKHMILHPACPLD